MSLVGAFAASHAPGITGRPSLPPAVESEPIFRAYQELRGRLEAARADVLIAISPEHWANFFLDNMPSFCIGLADEFLGPTDGAFVNIARQQVRGHARLARALAEGIAEAVDLSTSQEMAFDHGVMLPLHLLRTELPVIPIIVNCLAGMPAPLHRCHALGAALRRTVDRWPERVVVLGTGGLSHWPAMPESGRIGIDFDRSFLDAFLNARIENFLRFPNERIEAEAGPGGHEIRTWIAVAGTAGDARGSLLAYQPVPAWSTGCAVAVLEIEEAAVKQAGQK
jgi:2,3-dihydroxyphenylpropionate 1,2-dioxygenase